MGALLFLGGWLFALLYLGGLRISDVVRYRFGALAANITKGFYGDASMVYQRMKFVGGSLSSIASLGASLSSALAATDAVVEQHYKDVALNIVLGTLSALSGAAGFVATLTYCGPYLEKIAARQGLSSGAVRLFGLPAVGLAREFLEKRAIKVASGSLCFWEKLEKNGV